MQTMHGMHLVYVGVDFGHAVLGDAEHGVRLAAARLPVGENARCKAKSMQASREHQTFLQHWMDVWMDALARTVDAAEHGEGDLLGPFIVHLPGAALGVEHPVWKTCGRLGNEHCLPWQDAWS